jgi:DNA-binding transcriptional LysR family regulator
VWRVNLDLYRLSVFVTVVERNGYSAAARRLNLSQSTVSHHVSELERACGAELLRYHERAVHLTAAGQEVYLTAIAMLTEQSRLQDSLADLRQGRQGRVRLGVSMAFEQRWFFDEVVAPFSRSHRGTLLAVRFGHSAREAQAVLERELDLAYVMRWHLPAEARFEPLQEVELTFLAARSHPLAGQESVTGDEIAEAGLITAPLTGDEENFYRTALHEFGMTRLRSVLEVGGMQTRFLAAAAGLGVIATFLPTRPGMVDADLVALAVVGTPIRVQVGLVRRSDDPPASGTDDLATWLRRIAAR